MLHLKLASKCLQTLTLKSPFLLKIVAAAAAAAKSLQSCPTLCDPIDSSPPGSPVPGILQARTLEWVAISFSNTWKWKVKVKSLSRVRLLATPWTATHQAPPSMGFSRQEYWSGVPLPSPSWGIDLDYCDIEWFALETKIILSFWRLHPISVFWSVLLTMKVTPFFLRDSSPQ